ncbi:MAG TPA: hypothetical protein VGG39_36660 [Polyangiaceae bacterium]
MLGGRIALVRAVVAGALVVASLGACRGIAGLRDLTYVAPPLPCTAPSLPTEGTGRVRLVNASTAGTADFCIRASGTTAWGNPVLTGGGPSCPSGLDYAQATVPFAVPGGAVDVEVVPAGGSCDAPPSAQMTSIAVGGTQAEAGTEAGGGAEASAASPVVTIVRFGRNGGEQLVALPEEPPAHAEVSIEQLRLVNALGSGETINLGLATGSTAPATVTGLLPAGVDPGATPQAAAEISDLGSIDAMGYLSTENGVNAAPVFQGATQALFVSPTSSVPDTQTLFVLGDSGDDLYPPRGLLCEDALTLGDAGASSSGGVLASCQLSALPNLTVDTFNIALFGDDAPFEDDRRPAVLDAIARRPADVMCVLEANRDTDKAAIAAAAKARFPYAYYVTTDLDTPFSGQGTDDGGGETPTSGPPCPPSLASVVDGIIQCLAQSCSTTGDTSGYVPVEDCMEHSCPDLFGQLLYSADTTALTCGACLAYNVTSDTPLAQAETSCTTDSRQPFAFQGMTPSMILSRYPLANTQAYELPSTGWRRAGLYAQLQLEDQNVDFYCAQLTSPLLAGLVPYVGAYGTPDAGTTGGWEAEQDMQVRQVISWVQGITPPGGHAIIAGDWHAGLAASIPAADGGAMPVLVDTAPEVLRALDQAYGGPFVRAEPPGYAPSCEYCPAPANPYNGTIGAADLTATFLLGFAPGSALADSFWGTDAGAVTLTYLPFDPDDGPTGPLSPYYPRSVQILRPLLR